MPFLFGKKLINKNNKIYLSNFQISFKHNNKIYYRKNIKILKNCNLKNILEISTIL